MREIKFRAWDQNKGKMFEVIKINWASCAVWFKGKTYIGNLGDHDYGCILMQYTGLHDKNGKEIYEGDILYCESERYIGTVAFIYGSFQTDAYGWGFSVFGNEADCEVIGNIYDNPELLNQERSK